jgi:autotransporter-associated beta strand protein
MNTTKNVVTLLVGVFLGFAIPVRALDGTWTNDASTAWSVAGSWLNGAVAGGAGSVADFSAVGITADRKVTLDLSLSVGTLKFGDAGMADHNWMLDASGNSVLTLDTGSDATPVIFVSNQTATVSLGLTGTNGVTKTGAGTLVWTSNTVSLTGGGLQVRNGTLSLTNTTYNSTANATDSIGKNAGDFAVLRIQGTSLVQRTRGSVYVGDAVGSTGLVYMTGGTYVNSADTYIGNAGFGVFVQTGGQIWNNGEFDPGGGAPSAYGYYQLSGGSLNVNNWLQPSRFGLGLFYQDNGAIAVTNLGYGLVLSDCGAGTGVLYQTGGTLSVPFAGLAWAAGARGELTVAGSGQFLVNGNLRFNNGSGTSIVNLLGGVTRANQLGETSAGGLSLLTFNGGKLQANTSGTLLGVSGQMLDAVYIYSGGAVIDSQSYSAVCAQPLLAPGGYGVAGIDLSAPISGYLGAPYVSISGGSGAGATAVALFDYTQGSVTGVVVTSAGTGYQSGDAVTAALINGGQTNVVLSGVRLAGNVSGGLTKLGTGTLSLTAANTYSGDTFVTVGALQAQDGTGLPSDSFLSLNGGVLQGTGTFARALGTSGSSKVQWTAAGGGFSANGGQMTVTINGGTDELVWGVGVGSQLVGPLRFGSTTANATTLFQNGIDLSAANRTVDVTAGSGGDAAEISGVIRTSSGTAGLIKTGNGKLILSGANTYNGGTVVSNGTFAFGSQDAAANAGAVTLTSGATYDLGGFTVTNTSLSASSATIKNGTLFAPSFVFSGGNVSATLAGPVALTNTSGTLVLSGLNAYTGGTFLNGGTVSVSSDDNLSGVGTALTFNGGWLQVTGTTLCNLDNHRVNWGSFNGGLDIANTGNTFVVTSNLTTSAVFSKAGAGTLVWTNNAVTVTGGGLQVRGGTLLLANATYRDTANVIDSVGKYAGDVAMLRIQTNSLYQNAGSLYVGDAYGSTGLVFMTGGFYSNAVNTYVGNAGFGSFIQTGGVLRNVGEFDPGGNVGTAYGYYQMSGGSMTNSNWVQASRIGTMGLIYQDGGRIAIISSGLVVANNGIGVVYQNGGVLSTPLVYMTFSANSRGELTVAGSAQLTVNGILYVCQAAGTSILNLQGGVVRANQVYKNTASGLGFLNFNGGTLQAGTSGAFVGAPGKMLDAAYVYRGGAVIDSQGYSVTNSQSFLSPPGCGVAGLSLSAPVGGYLGAPYVSFSGGSGTGATAVALFDYTANAVTGLVVTCAGFGYKTNDAVNATLTGGGQTNLVLRSLPLTNNVCGGLTKLGTGTLALIGTNTYSGATVISNGTLSLCSAVCLSTNTAVTITDGAVLNLNFVGTNVVRSLQIGNVLHVRGVYNAARCPGVITGAGAVRSTEPVPPAGTLIRVR